ncbi:MAG: hypothetical protein PHR96_00025 [Clostridia bacterium]|nr:hypothetical protein [Clostridia bacterium]
MTVDLSARSVRLTGLTLALLASLRPLALPVWLACPLALLTPARFVRLAGTDRSPC